MMKYNYIVIVLLFSLLFALMVNCRSVVAGESTVVEGKQPQNLEIYLLIGQSNMAGRAEIGEQDKDTLANVFLFTGMSGKEWEKAANPLNKYSTVRKDIALQKLGPGYTFAKEMARAHSGKKIGLVVNAKGGTNIVEWKPGSTLYTEAVKRAKLAMQSGTLKGIVWHQGESNSSKPDDYPEKIAELIQSLRTDLGIPDLPFVAGQLSEDKPQRHDFNVMILKLPTLVPYTGVATTEGTVTMEGTHFNSASQRLLGERYAAEMLKLLKK